MPNLLTSSESLRRLLYTRNLYTPYVQYPLPMNNVEKTITVIDNIVGGIAPFKSINLPDTVLARVINIGDETPLSKIGLTMLAKQMTLNEMSHVAQKTFPIIKVSNLFDGNPSTNLFTPNIDYRITVDNNQGEFGRFIDKIFFSQQSSANPFHENGDDNSFFIENTGKGQLIILYNQLGYNTYRPDVLDNTTFYDFANESGSEKIVSNPYINKIYFDLGNKKLNPYRYNSITDISRLSEIANKKMIENLNNISSLEYGIDSTYINNLGYITKTTTYDLNSDNSWVNDNDYNSRTIIWGSDGVSNEYLTKELENLRGNFNKPELSSNEDSFNSNYGFNVQNGGLLEYTKNLISANAGHIGDLTKKAFRHNDKTYGFNGSGLWKSNNSNYAQKSGFNDHTGVRQHTVLDQYDRFTKAIRFNGNRVYDGNPDSVIYDRVTPQITPRLKNDKLDVKNLMFSIENLAVHVIRVNKYGTDVGVMDDENGSVIPNCEVGPFNGRIMWFPPYALDIQETATAKYESTVMVGRNEPMYNYMNSERTATLNFKLLIDYPPHVEGKDYKEAAEFFAFGGDSINGNTDIPPDIDIIIKNKEEERDRLIVTEEPPKFKTPQGFYIYYPNDYPKPSDSNSTTIFDEMYKKRYEIREDVDASEYNNSEGGLNKYLYFISGLTEYTDSSGNTKYKFDTEPTFSQYTATGLTNEDGSVCVLNKILHDAFVDDKFVEYYDINIVGGASQLFTTDYNKLLGTRRAKAARNLIESRLKTMFPNIKPNFTNYELNSEGEENAVPEGAKRSNINKENVKIDRFAHITFIPKQNPPNPKQKIIDEDRYKSLIVEIEELENLKKKQNIIGNSTKDCVFGKQPSDKMLNQFESFNKNHKYYQPIFHSQTPEDFHKRLTFLQQCTRQGSSKSYYYSSLQNSDKNKIRNSVFARQPICILRIGDFFYTKVIIESVTVQYTDTTWDMNPEGFGMQPMIADVALTMKVIGGQSLKGPIDALQNAVSYNYYANSTYTDKGRYKLPSEEAEKQSNYMEDVMKEDVARYKEVYNNKFNSE